MLLCYIISPRSLGGRVGYTSEFVHQEVLDYLSLFADPGKMQIESDEFVHPLDLVMGAFRDDEAAACTCRKLHTFMEDLFKVHGKSFPRATGEATQPNYGLCMYCLCPKFSFVCKNICCVNGPVSDQDLATMARSTRLTTRVPLDAIHIRPPVDGLPVVEDFLTCCISFLFSGSRLDREPVDLCLDEHIPPPEEGYAYRPVLSVKKGFTRLLLGLIICTPFLSLSVLTVHW